MLFFGYSCGVLVPLGGDGGDGGDGGEGGDRAFPHTCVSFDD